MKQHTDVLIVGAGLYGAVYARQMLDAGKSVRVIDRRDHIGGNIYTRDVRGIQVHEYGAHIFHTSDKEVWDYVQRFVTMNHYINSPVAIYHDELYNLPFNMNTFSKMWGIKTPDEAKAIIRKQSEEAIREIVAARNEEESILPPPRGGGVAKGDGEGENDGEDQPSAFTARNLEEQGLSLAGRDIFEKLIREYTEKQWGRPCTELPAFIIQRLPFRFTYDNNYFNDPYQGIPVEGYTALIERLLNGAEVVLGCDWEPVNVASTGSATTADNATNSADPESFGNAQEPPVEVPAGSASDYACDRLVYTGRIDSFFDEKFGTLEYRSLKFEHEDLPDTDNYQGNAVVNYTSHDVAFTRIIEHKHFNFGKGEGTVITREYPADWHPGDEPYYPVNDDKNNALYERYAEEAAKLPDVRFGGRLGTYRYYNMDQIIRQALDDAGEDLG